VVIHPADACTEVASDEFCQEGDDGEGDDEPDDVGCELVEVDEDAKGDEKDWGKDHLDMVCALAEVGVLSGSYSLHGDTREERTDNRRQADGFRGGGEEEGDDEGEEEDGLDVFLPD